MFSQSVVNILQKNGISNLDCDDPFDNITLLNFIINSGKYSD